MSINTWRHELEEAAKLYDGVVSIRGNSHLVIKLPNGAKVYTSATPSDWRAIRKIKRDLKYAAQEPAGGHHGLSHPRATKKK